MIGLFRETIALFEGLRGQPAAVEKMDMQFNTVIDHHRTVRLDVQIICRGLCAVSWKRACSVMHHLHFLGPIDRFRSWQCIKPHRLPSAV
jgi:hypothetical protein